MIQNTIATNQNTNQKKREKEFLRQQHPQFLRKGWICLNVGDDKGGGDVHLEDHAENLDDSGDASVSVLVGEEKLVEMINNSHVRHLIGDHDHNSAKEKGVDAKESAVGPPSAHLVCKHST